MKGARWHTENNYTALTFRLHSRHRARETMTTDEMGTDWTDLGCVRESLRGLCVAHHWCMSLARHIKKILLSDHTQTQPKVRPQSFGCFSWMFRTSSQAEWGNVLVYTHTIISDGSGTDAILIKAIFFSKINTKISGVLSHLETQFSCPLECIQCFFLHSFRRLDPDYALLTRHKGTALSKP